MTTKKERVNADSLMEVSIGMALRAMDTTTNQPVSAGFNDWSWTAAATEDDLPDFLRSMANAIENGQLYGFMQQECANSPVEAGEWRSETTEEMMERCKTEGSDYTHVVKIT